MFKKLLKKLRCFSICGSKCMLSLNDTNNDGVPDEVVFDNDGNELLKVKL